MHVPYGYYLEEVFITDEKENVCNICYEDCNTKLINCSHHVHKECHKEWDGPCSVCNSDIIYQVKKEINL